MKRKFLITTDVRFWRRQTGAQQRIFALADFLRTRDFDLRVCFTSSLTDSSPSEARSIVESGFEIISLIDDWRPNGVWQKMTWQAKCVANSVFPAPTNPHLSTSGKPFTAFKSKEITKRFHQLLREETPEIVLIEYATLAYLVPTTENRRNIRFLIDTHDILWKRNQVFLQNGFHHWVDITSEQETEALKKFDLILAIQPDEAKQLSDMVHDQVPVVVVGHPTQAHVSLNPPRQSKSTVLGMLASANDANFQSLTWFFDNVWKRCNHSNDLQFVLAGSITDSIDETELPANVRLLGRIDKLPEFYDQIDVVINPVQFGTGLKIKTIEAFAFGKPLLSTTHGISGITFASSDPPYLLADTAEEWIESLTRLNQNPDLKSSLSQRAFSFAQSKLSPDVVYADLLTELLRLCTR